MAITTEEGRAHVPRAVPRPFEMHWGRGHIVEEASIDSPHHEPTIQLLEYEDGSESLRFCYYHGARFGRGALMVDGEWLDDFADALREKPRIRALLKRMLGEPT